MLAPCGSPSWRACRQSPKRHVTYDSGAVSHHPFFSEVILCPCWGFLNLVIIDVLDWAFLLFWWYVRAGVCVVGCSATRLAQSNRGYQKKSADIANCPHLKPTALASKGQHWENVWLPCCGTGLQPAFQPHVLLGNNWCSVISPGNMNICVQIFVWTGVYISVG